MRATGCVGKLTASLLRRFGCRVIPSERQVGSLTCTYGRKIHIHAARIEGGAQVVQIKQKVMD
jgi:hypothetical protein